MTLRVGLVGLGSIGQLVADEIRHGAAGDAELVGVLRRQQPLKDLLTHSPEIVVEAASPGAVTAHAEPILSRGISLVIASGSALMDSAFRLSLEQTCRRSGARIYVPAGAFAGLDVLYATAGHLDHFSLRIVDPGADVDTRYRGPAADGVARYPTRLNLAAVATLASGHPIQLEYAHGPMREIELTASGDFGQLHTRTTPNPRTVALSLLAVLRRLQQPIIFG